MQASAFIYRKSTSSWLNVPALMYWHKVLHKYLSANVRKLHARVGLRGFTVVVMA
jgi:hypothetical protein